MLALAIDTSGDLASVTLAKDDTIVAELTFRHKMDLLRRLMPQVDRLFEDTGTEKRSIDGVVVSTGPGSFTGLRIGVATAKSIAYALGKPIVGIPTLDVLANGASVFSGLIVPMIHARPGEVYAAVFDGEDRLSRLTEDRALLIEDLADEIKAYIRRPVLFCGDGMERNVDALKSRFPEAVFSPRWLNHPSGGVLAALGLERLIRGDVDNPVSLVPHYVKRSTPEIRLEQQSK